MNFLLPSVLALIILVSAGCSIKGSVTDVPADSGDLSIGIAESDKTVAVNDQNKSHLGVSGSCKGFEQIEVEGVISAKVKCENDQFNFDGLDLSKVPDGTVELTIYGVKFGKKGASPIVVRFIKDTLIPVVAFNSSVTSNVGSSTVAAFTINGACSENDRSVKVTVGSVSQYLSCAGGIFSNSLDLSSLADGSYTATIAQSDAAGNQGTAVKTIVINRISPLISVSAAAPILGNSGSNFVFTVSYTSATAVTLTSSDVALTGTATAGCSKAVSGSGVSSRTVTISGCTGNGSVGISIAAGTASNGPANLAASATSSASATVHNTAPTISSVTGPSPSIGKSSATFIWTVNFDSAITLNTTSSNATLGGTATSLCSVTIASVNSTSATVSVTSCTGNGTLQISSLASTLASDAAGNALTPWVVGASTANVDNTAPTVSSISAPSPSSGNSGASFVYTVTYDGNVTVVTTSSNVTLGGTATAGCSKSIAQGAANTAAVTVTGCTGNGTLNVASLAAGTATDAAGNSASSYSTASANATVDNTAPTISSISAPSPTSGNSGASFVFTVTYDGNVTVATTSTNVTLGGTATAGCSKSIAQGAANTAIVTVTGCTGNGTLNVASLAAGTATDAAGNSASSYSTASANATVDNTAPTISSISAPSPTSGNSAASFVFTVTYDGNVTVVTTSTNVTLGGTATAGCSKSIAQGAANTAIVTVTGCTGNGTLNVASVAAGTATDAAGNSASSYSTASANATVDNTAPTVSSISAPSPSTGNSGASFAYTVTYDGNVTVVTTSTNVTLGGTATAGCSKSIAQGAANTAIVTVTGCTGNGTLNVASLAAGTATDAAGNSASSYSTASANATVDNTAPTISSISAPSPSSGNSGASFVYTVTYDGNVTVVTTSSNVTLGGTATAGCSKSIAQGAANTAAVTVTGCTGNGTLNVASLAAGTATDAAGNSASSYSTASGDATVSNSALPTLSFSSTSPASPSVGTVPYVIGTSSANTATVKLYSDITCTTLIGSGTKASFEGAGIAATVTVGATTAIYGLATTSGAVDGVCTFLANFTNSFASVPAMAVAHGYIHFAKLNNGKIIAALGYNASSANTGTAHLYDPSLNTWTATGSVTTARRDGGYALLSNGKFLVAGGYAANASTAAELYDPTAGTWSSAGTLVTARWSSSMAVAGNGKALYVGGVGVSPGFTFYGTTELYDPGANTWSAGPTMSSARARPIAITLNNGKILVAGGQAVSGGPAVSSAELYDPTTNTFSATGSMVVGRYAATFTKLTDGRILVAGGITTVNVSSAEIYDPTAGTWSATGSMSLARSYHSAVLLSSGKVYVVGNTASTGNQAELFDPGAGTWSAQTTLSVWRQTAGLVEIGLNRILFFSGVQGGAGLASSQLVTTTP